MKLPLIALSCYLIACPASAGGGYVGAGWGRATFGVDGGSARVETDDSGYKLYGGYGIARRIFIEAAYTDLLDGSASSQGFDFDLAISYGSVAAVGFLPIHRRLKLWAKLQAARWEADIIVDDGIDPPVDRSADGIDLGYAIGFDWYALRRLGIRGEWERFDFGEIDDLEYLAVGVIFRIGDR
jgi:OOP family OmpA-OmpF porin